MNTQSQGRHRRRRGERASGGDGDDGMERRVVSASKEEAELAELDADVSEPRIMAVASLFQVGFGV